MRILVTLGGTSERIDQVRSITNHSTGKLGVEVVHALAQEGIFVDVLAATSAIHPATSKYVTLRTIYDTKDLYENLIELMTLHTYDAVIHSMAVSDFTTQTSFSEEAFLATLNHWIQLHPSQEITSLALNQLLKESMKVKENKLSSDTDHLVLFLEKTPKVIQKIKEIQPETLLIGFKLLVNVSNEELFSVALKSLKKSQSDYVLANDLNSITDTSHTGYLLNQQGLVGQATTKPEIAKLLVKEIQQALAQKEQLS